MEQSHLPFRSFATYDPEQQESVAVGEEKRLRKENKHKSQI